MTKIAADLRLLSSGPHGGFGDLTIPVAQAGSSIMPTKVNPVTPEYVMQLSYRVRGQALTVDYAAADGELELNMMEPIVLDAPHHDLRRPQGRRADLRPPVRRRATLGRRPSQSHRHPLPVGMLPVASMITARGLEARRRIARWWSVSAVVRVRQLPRR